MLAGIVLAEVRAVTSVSVAPGSVIADATGDGFQAVLVASIHEAGKRNAPLVVLLPANHDAIGTAVRAELRHQQRVAGYPLQSVVAVDDVAEAVSAASRFAAIVVIAGPNGVESGPASETRRRIAAHAKCPTLIVPRQPRAFHAGGIVLALGLSPSEQPAIEFAFQRAQLDGVPVRAVHVWSGLPEVAIGSADPFAYDRETARDGVDREIAEQLAGYSDSYPDVVVQRMPRYSENIVSGLLDAFAYADMAVVTANRHPSSSCLLVSPTVAELIRSTPCPLVIVPSER
jgi:nucleotide-binding universal stress UspA family protein